ncbi:SusC/RagA family TonB-linked outer membrane protein [Puteibacter caeruleilacunae]|nr:SusC/RagA family TonB-linked outer membrane protein [Puteibacter caeruleilacunae]
MKKTNMSQRRVQPPWIKLLRMMKITCILLLVGLMQVSAASYSQSAKISLKLKNAKMVELFNEIERASEYRFFYDSEQLNTMKDISIAKTNVTVQQVLNEVFKSTDLQYEIIDRNIVIKKKQGESGFVQQNNQSVSGVVTERLGDPLPGVSVVVKGTTIGVTTDIDGKYVLDLPANTNVIVFSFVGMKTQEVSVDGQAVINLIMEEDAIGLEEVVAVGYGVQKKVNLTGSVATVSADEINKRPITNPVSALQGTVAGLRIVQNSGEPGAEGTSIRIRGQGTFSSAGSNPLILVDGVPGSLSDLSPNDIESVSVLKDAASASIYGSRAANGVILVTTKQGKEGQLNVDYTGSYSIHTPTKMLDLITNSAEYMELWNEAKENTGISSGLYTQEQINTYRNATDRTKYPNTDWIDILFDPAPTHTHNLSFNGGVKNTKYYVSLGYVNQEGVMNGFDYEKFNARFNLTSQINDKVKIGANIGLKKGDKSAPRQGATDTFLSTLSQAPTYGPRLPDGSGRYTYKAYDFESNNKNTIAIAESGALKTTIDYSVSAQGWTDIQLAKGLNWYTKAAMDLWFSKAKDFRPEVDLYNFHTGDRMTNLDVGGRGLTVTDQQTVYYNLFSYLKYTTSFAEDHQVSFQAGYSQEEEKYEYLQGYRKEFAKNNLKELNAGSAAVQNAYGSANEWALMSFFGRLNYDYKGKYLAEANLRYDGSSRIHPDSRWGAFPSFSAGWRISEESFIKNANWGWLTDLKIRASYGELGNQKIGNYPYQELISLTSSYPYNNSNLSSGAAQTKLSNDKLKWESTSITDIGFDLVLFDGLTANFDYYKKETSDILRSSQVTGFVGLSAPTVNDGKIQNTGIELKLQYQDELQSGFLHGLKYSVWGTLDKYKNKLVKFGEREIGGSTIKEEGRPWDSFYMLEWDGIFQTEEEVASSAKQYNDDTRPGDIKYVDQNNDGKIDNDDKVVIDGQFPKFEYSFNFNAEWRGIDFSMFFQGVQGRKILVKDWGTIPFIQGAPPTKDWRNRWTEENPSTTMPRIYWGWNGGGKITRTSTYFLQDASYLRLKNLQVGYTLPKRLISKVGLKKLRIFFSGDNLLTFTDYPGLDPERGGSGRFVNYPQNKIYSFGLNARF